VIQRTDNAGFPLEPFRKLFSRNLNRNFASQSRIASAVYLTHPTFADCLKDFVRAEFVTYRKRHVLDSA
jgi:hypothetical protein